MLRRWRSNSVAVKPNRATRSASVKAAVRPRSTPLSGTSTFSEVASIGPMNSDRLVWAARKGGFGACAISSNRSDSMPLNRRSTRLCR